jgi:LAO/AO transport system kinase
MVGNKKLQTIIEGVLSGKTDMLSKAITLVESQRSEDREDAAKVLAACSSSPGTSLRIAISGAPGVGKSTFINVFGQHLIQKGKRVAVLAIDPSSEKSKGSILGDKTRMAQLAVEINAYIRPSPTSGALGGITRNTHEAMLLCEAAGFDVIIIETVGVGQSETAVSNLVDLFILLVIAGAGDELQGIKRGIMEQADLVVVNKSDRAEKVNLRTAIQDLKNALHMFPPNDKGFAVEVLSSSAIENKNIDIVCEKALDLFSTMQNSGVLDRSRSEKAVTLMHQMLRTRILGVVFDRITNQEMRTMETAINNGELSPFQAVDELLKTVIGFT